MNNIIEYEDGLPPFENFAKIDEASIEELPELIKGILSKTEIFAIEGPPKSYKSWMLMDLALSIASGEKWLGFETTKGRVLYVDFNSQEPDFLERLVKIEKEKGITQGFDSLAYWNLLGHAASIDVIVPLIIKKAKRQDYSMIIIDPVYKMLGERDTESTSDMNEFFDQLDRLAQESGAAIVIDSFLEKLNRAVDTVFTLIRSRESGTLNVDVAVRSFPPVKNFKLEWQVPLLHRLYLRNS